MLIYPEGVRQRGAAQLAAERPRQWLRLADADARVVLPYVAPVALHSTAGCHWCVVAAEYADAGATDSDSGSNTAPCRFKPTQVKSWLEPPQYIYVTRSASSMSFLE